MTTSDDMAGTQALTEIALELFKVHSLQPGVSSQQLAIECFRAAAVFKRVADDVQRNGIDQLAEDNDPLDIAFAPNLKKTHPVYLMSRAWGDLKQVQATLAELDANPAAEFYEPFGWGKPEVNQARALFPAVVNRAEKSTTTK